MHSVKVVNSHNALCKFAKSHHALCEIHQVTAHLRNRFEETFVFDWLKLKVRTLLKLVGKIDATNSLSFST